MSDDIKGARKRRGGRSTEDDNAPQPEADVAPEPAPEPTAAGSAPSLIPKAESAPEASLSAKTPHNHAFETKFVPSILSSNSTEQNFRGLFHLAGLILFFANFRLVLENLMKYGILLSPSSFANYLDPRTLPILLTLPVTFGMAYWLQLLACRKQISENTSGWLNTINLGCLLVIPLALNWILAPAPASGIFVLLASAVMWLKLISYSLANREYRRRHFEGKPVVEVVDGVKREELVMYPNNLTITDLLYFTVAPTLCYQMNYPRTPAIRWYWLFGKIAQLIFFLLIAIFLVEQYCFPVVKNSVTHLKAGNFPGIIERVMKLSIPGLYVWLIMFYAFFHLWLNILAEVLRFGYRQFYLDWWNATTMDYYWRTWNIPTHHWLARHIYFPAIRHGLNKKLASLLVFFFSAVFHELLISLPLRTFKLYFFFGMMSQVPLMFWSGSLKGTVLGNLIFWLSFCFVGQPTGILLYYFDYTQEMLRGAVGV